MRKLKILSNRQYKVIGLHAKSQKIVPEPANIFNQKIFLHGL